ncbi:MAG TPA: alanine--tRNA ligase [Patescibacteria group bacterium]|nr:alanine--tRNA ligase [Patescibacteria group bacterium]
MTANELKEKYFNFFKKKSHTLIPSSSVVPENDPTVLFTTAGMHPLVPYLLGEPHPLGKRLVGVQKCIRTDDIDEVGDTFHHTFFEMLGNWSLGDYWKEESITWSYEFLTKELNLDPKRIWVTCFEGDNDAPKDMESAKVWKSLGISDERIFYYGKKDNWWGPAGVTGPCGPDSEIFYDITGKPHGNECKPGDNCGRFFEIWNNVFMQYNKATSGKYEPLKQKNVDTGMGVERTTAVLSGYDDDYMVSDLWGNILSLISKLTKTDYKGNEKAHRIIADHVRASCFMIADQVFPSNKDRGYILRRLIRRAVRYGKTLGVEGIFVSNLIESVVKTYQTDYPELKTNENVIKEIMKEEEERFLLTLERGLKEIEKYPELDGKNAFFLYETYGFPLELTEEIAKERGQKIDKSVFEKEFEKHKNLSRTTSAGMFKGGLADHGEEVTKLHTATHLVHAALRKILGDHVSQKGSNITAERLRFDFSHTQKLTNEEIKKVEDLVNENIKNDLPVTFKVMTLNEAIKEGALHFFAEKYQEKVKVYTIGNFSWEVCGGPHVNHTHEIGHVRISKQEKIGSGLVRIYVTRSIN